MSDISYPAAERYVLSCCLNYKSAIIDIAAMLLEEDFAAEYNRLIYRACVVLAENDLEVSVTDIWSYFEKTKRTDVLDELGGVQYIERIKQTPVQVENVEEYIAQIKQASARRVLLQNMRDAMKVVRDDEGRSPAELVTFVEERVLEVNDFIANTSDVVNPIGVDLRSALSEREKSPGILPGYPTGFNKLDKALRGLQPGRVYILCAPKKTGKSAFLLNVARHLAVDPPKEKQVPVLYVTTEHRREEDRDRLCAMVANVEEEKIENGLYTIDSDEKSRVYAATKKIEEGSIYHAYLPAFTFETLYSLTRKYVKTKGVKVLIFDYIKVPDDASFKQGIAEWVWIGQVMNGIVNRISGGMNIPVLTAAQINREGQKNRSRSSVYVAGGDKIPQYASGAMMYLFEKNDEDKERTGKDTKNGTHILTIGESRYMSSDAEYHLWFDKPKLRLYERKVVE